MDNPVHPDPKQELPPPPDEKLLRAPTFAEKYPWVKLTVVFVLVVVILVAGISVMNTDQKAVPQTQPSPSPLNATSPTIDVTADWRFYTSQEGKFSVKHPQDYTIQDNVPNTIQILSPVLANLNTNFRITITYKDIVGNPTLPQLIDQNKLCGNIASQGGTPSLINGKTRAQVYFDAPCGQDVKTVIYTVNEAMFYIISIDTQASYSEIKPYIDQIIATLSFLDNKQTASDNPIAPEETKTFCTMEAKLCPDGSSVGRHGPKCEFDACPGATR